MLQLKVEAIKWETVDTATFYLSGPAGKKISYQAGQFITLIFSHHQNEIRRSYSISSSPAEALLAITVKRIANGEISRFLLSKTKVGDILNALAPTGKFLISEPDKPKDIFYFAAGSGIAPVYAHLKWIFSQAGKSHITLVYSNRNKAGTLFFKELNEMAIAYVNRFTLIYLYSEGTPDGRRPRRLNNELVVQLVKNNLSYQFSQADFFLCGPFVYMRMIKLTLQTMHIKPSQIRKENFVVETTPDVKAYLSYPPKPIQINLAGTVYNLVVGENQTILDAALQNGIQLPYSCKAGICSNCTAICRTGKVVMTVNDVLTDEDIRAGWMLTCTGHPLNDDVVVEFL
jgi:ferredoxin-NADP reductase